MTWRSRWACCWRVMWLAIRLEYCTSLCRLSTSAIVVGSAPDGFHRCTAKISESLRGSSSNTASVGVFDRIPPSQYSSPSMRVAGNPERFLQKGVGELNWDGGILTNTPTEAVFDDDPRKDSLI